jgi:NAD(P)-dependent dehydrogenase (short-subunit alcohol dehydrogenase family)
MYEAAFCQRVDEGSDRELMVICELCPHKCHIPNGRRGVCGTRANHDGRLIAENYGMVSSLSLAPIEKKPLKRFMPGSMILSAGSYGCNFHCPFCQNHDIARPIDGPALCRFIEPADLVDMAVSLTKRGNIGLAYTYNEPITWYEYVLDTARLIKEKDMKNLFDIKDKVIIVTGGCGILGKSIANYLAEQGAKIVILDRVEEIGKELEAELNQKTEALFLVTDVLNKEILEENKKAILERFGTIDILLNAAGGNMPGATIAPDKTVLDLDVDAFKKVVDLNLFGTILPTMAFVDVMAKNKKGVIVNFCSESALRPLTRVVGYGSAKAAIANYTRYMATELATKFSPELRVNAIVPGFLLTNQNRALLTNPDGSYTDRAKTIIAHTPCGRFAEPEELFGTIHYLISDASSFVTGALSVVDGGFDAFSI